MTDDIKAIRDAMPTNPSFADQWADWMEACSPDRISRLLCEVDRLRAALEQIAQHTSSEWPERCQR